MEYGKLPEVISNHNILCNESMFYLYLPIKLAHEKFDPKNVPDRLKIFMPLIHDSLSHCNTQDKYIYISAKHMLVMPEFWGNRPGYHADGFLTDDINFIWYDSNPTVFNNSNFIITPDHVKSISEFESQAKIENEITYPCHTLLKLDQFVVHKVGAVKNPHMRTFIKISISEHQYNLTGNSHNYLMDYNWKMYDRQEVRNQPAYAENKNSDFIPHNK